MTYLLFGLLSTQSIEKDAQFAKIGNEINRLSWTHVRIGHKYTLEVTDLGKKGQRAELIEINVKVPFTVKVWKNSKSDFAHTIQNPVKRSKSNSGLLEMNCLSSAFKYLFKQKNPPNYSFSINRVNTKIFKGVWQFEVSVRDNKPGGDAMFILSKTGSIVQEFGGA